MSVATSGGRRRNGDALRSRAGRTLLALLGVGSVTLTTAAAAPLDPGTGTFRSDVLAVGQGGLGSILIAAPESRGADAGGARADGASERDVTRSTDRTGTIWTGTDWTGTDAGDPVLDATVQVPVLGEVSFASFIPAGVGGGGLGGAGIPAPTLRAYRAAAEVLAREAPGCRIDWALLAGIGRVEANHGRFGGAVVTDLGVSVPRILGPRLDGTLANTQVIRDADGGTLDGDASYDRAVGPMQFLPGTWARWGSDGDRDGASNPQDIDDAALAAARYLCQGRSGLDDPGQAALAVRRYNNSSSYVALVLATASGYRSGGGIGAGPWDGSAPFAPPPGWDLPPGTVVGQGPLDGPTTGAVGSPTPSATTTPATPTGQPVTPSPDPSGSPTSPPDEPSGGPTGDPSGTPTTGPSPTDSPTTSPSPTEPVPTCDPTSTAPASEPGDTVLPPCPPPCGTQPPSTVVPTPSPTPTCTPLPATTPPTDSPTP